MSKRRYDDGDHRGGRKRRRMVSEAAEIEDRLESLIIRVGEKSTSSLESNLEGLASVLEADLGSYKARILRILADCARRFPEKCSIYTTLIGLINVKNYNFGGEFVEVMVRTFKDSLKSCDWASAQYTLRFIADLVNCHVVSIGSLLQLINNMVDVTTEEGVPQVRKDWYVFAVLTCLPWIGRELYEQRELELDRLLGTIELYLHNRNTVHRKALCVWTSDSPHPQEEYLECLWAQMRKLKADGWQEKHIIRPWLAFDTVLCEALQHNLPPMLPPPHHADYRYPLPTCVFRLFDYTDCPDGPVLPGSHSIERFLIEEQLHYSLEQYHFERKDCAAQLLNFPAKTKVPLEYMIVEVIFSEMLALPAPRYLEICYGSVFIELCKLQPSTMPQVLAQATEMLYERIDTMNCCAFERLISWFSYHLSNFQYRWSWEDWAGCLSLQPLAPKRKFVSEVLEKSLRLTYIQRLVEILPEKFRCLLPVKPDHDFIYERENGDSIPGAEFSKQLIELIKSKPSTDDVVKFLNQIDPSPSDDAPNAPASPLRLQVFIQSLLYLGHKTVSHSFAALAKYHGVFKLVAQSEDAQILILKNMYQLWHRHPKMLNVLVDKMLKTQIVECASVMNWLFSKEMSHEFTRNYVWEIAHATIKKMNKHMIKLECELKEMRDKLEGGKGDISSEESDEDSTMREQTAPNEEQLERLEERVEAAQANQKNLYLIIFQRFIMLLSEHIVAADTDGMDFRTHWFKWVYGRLQQIFMMHHEQVYRYRDTLESLLFTRELDPHVLEAFHQFCALRE